MSLSVSISTPGKVRSRRTALVVDDVDDMLDLLEIALNAADFTVLRASSADEAIAMFDARADEIDLLMTDVRVGTDSGLELAGRLLQNKPSLRVLAMSGFALEGKLISEQGPIEFLPKPFSTSELRNKLQTIFAPQPARLTITVSSDSLGLASPSPRGPGPARVSRPTRRY